MLTKLGRIKHEFNEFLDKILNCKKTPMVTKLGRKFEWGFGGKISFIFIFGGYRLINSILEVLSVFFMVIVLINHKIFQCFNPCSS